MVILCEAIEMYEAGELKNCRIEGVGGPRPSTGYK